MSLRVWAANGWLLPHATTPREIANLLALAERDLQQSEIAALSPEWQLSIAHNAALQSATAALAAAGYRASRDNHHLRVIQSLLHTVALDSETVQLLDTYRKLRNVSDYDRAGAVSKVQAREMHELAVLVHRAVLLWLRANYPHLLP